MSINTNWKAPEKMGSGRKLQEMAQNFLKKSKKHVEMTAFLLPHISLLDVTK